MVKLLVVRVRVSEGVAVARMMPEPKAAGSCEPSEMTLRGSPVNLLSLAERESVLEVPARPMAKCVSSAEVKERARQSRGGARGPGLRQSSSGA